MFQKAGWRLKQMISHRRNVSLEDFDNNSKTPTASSKGLPWGPNHPPYRETISSSASINERKHSKVSTAYSSTSSLCSCGSGNAPAIYLSLSAPQSVPNTSEILYLPPLLKGNTIRDTKTWQLIFSEDLALSTTNYQHLDIERALDAGAPFPVAPPYELNKTISVHLADPERITTPNIETSKTSTKENWSPTVDNVELLIRETDQAFQTVGNALADTKDATGDWYDMSSTRTVTIPRRVVSTTQQNQPMISKNAITRAKSGARARKPIFQHRRIKQGTKAASKSTTSDSLHYTSWTDATYSMVDALSGKLFKTEVDEMLSPGKLEQLRYEIRAKKASLDLEEGREQTEVTLIEPMPSESLSSRVSTATARISTPPVSPLPPPAIPRKNAARKMSRASNFERKMLFEDMSFPTPPCMPTSSLEYTSNASLPTIHEQKHMSSSPVYPKAPNLVRPLLSRQSTSSQLVLPSTPYTLTSPLFRHGPIVIDRPHLKREDVRADESLDWTAFQMAIAGTTNEEYNADEVEQIFDEAELDDLAEWWDRFGMGLGDMAVEKPTLREKSNVRMAKNHRQRTQQVGPVAEDSVRDGIMKRQTEDGVSSSAISESPQIRASVHKVIPWDVF